MIGKYWWQLTNLWPRNENSLMFNWDMAAVGWWHARHYFTNLTLTKTYLDPNIFSHCWSDHQDRLGSSFKILIFPAKYLVLTLDPALVKDDLLKLFYINLVLIASHKFYDITRIIFSREPFVSLGNLQTDPLTQNLLDILSSPLACCLVSSEKPCNRKIFINIVTSLTEFCVKNYEKRWF